MKKNILPLLKQIEDEASDLHPLEKRIVKNALKNLDQTFQSKGEFNSYDDTKLLLWEYAIANAEKEIFAISTNRHTLSGFGFSRNPQHIEIQARAIAKGVEIHRIFATSQADYEQFDFMELVRTQLKTGIDVWIAYANAAEYINSELENEQENYVIIDGKLLYRSFVIGDEARNSITFDTERVKKYTAMFHELKSRSYQFQPKDLPKAFSEL